MYILMLGFVCVVSCTTHAPMTDTPVSYTNTGIVKERLVFSGDVIPHASKLGTVTAPPQKMKLLFSNRTEHGTFTAESFIHRFSNEENSKNQ